MDTQDPNLTRLKIEALDPKRANARVAKEEATRTYDLTLMALPMPRLSRTDMQDPSLTLLKIDTLDPARPKPRTEMSEPR